MNHDPFLAIAKPLLTVIVLLWANLLTIDLIHLKEFAWACAAIYSLSQTYFLFFHKDEKDENKKP